MRRLATGDLVMFSCWLVAAPALLWATPDGYHNAQTPAPQTYLAAPANTEADKEFLKRVNAYVALHKKVESSLKIKPTKDPAKIKPRENELARQINLVRRHPQPLLALGKLHQGLVI
jgi:hypothetical protein